MNPPPLPSRRKRNLGIVALVVVGLLLVGAYGCWVFSKAKTTAIFIVKEQRPIVAKAVIHSYSVALITYRGRAGSFPTTAEGLDALVKRPASAPANWQPAMSRLQPDPWGRPYQYVSPNPATPNDLKSYDLFSLGPDGVVSGDDIRNP